MKFGVASLSAACMLLSLSLTAHAGNDWSHTKSFEWSKTTGIRVVEPEGFKVSVGDAHDEVPAVFNLPSEAGYYKVKLTAPDGAKWTKKIEVKAGKQTVLKVNYAKKAAKKKDKNVPTYMGKVANENNKCPAAQRYSMKFEFLGDDGTKKEIKLNSGIYEPNFELPKGKYRVRYHRFERKRWVFVHVKNHTIDKDGWLVKYGCK